MPPQRADPATPQPGDVVAGKYRLVRPVGLGAMGLVFEADHLRMRHPVAIKFMQSKLVGQPDAVARFEREGRAASRLTSPHATRIFDVDTTTDGVPYIVSELLEGHDLRFELDDRKQLPVEEAIGYVIQACAAMAEAHSLGIVHRDLKPSNLFLAKTSTGRVVKVLDFGISKMEEELELTNTGIQLGSPRYMSPEQVEAKRVDRRADIWSLGVILFRAIAGAYPFEGSTSISLALAILTQPPRDLVSLAPDVPPGLVAAIGKALTRDIDLRHSTARDFAEALAPFASPEAATLARSLTQEVPSAAETSRPSLPMRAPDGPTLTNAGKDIDALIEVSFEPPEQATRGTWAQPASVKPQGQTRRSSLVLTLGAVLGAAALLSLGTFTLGRHGFRASAPASAAVAVGGGSADPTPSAPPAVASETPHATATPEVPASASASSAMAPPPVPSNRAAKPAAGAGRATPRSAGGTGPSSPPPSQPPKNPTYL
jgi:serine/threonine protein kinase